MKIFFFLILFFTFFPSSGWGQELVTPDKEREKAIQELGNSAIPDLEAIKLKAQQVYSKPVAEQNEGELKNLSEEANRLANLIDYLRKEYREYYSDNYKYDFVQKKVAPPHDAYVQLGNEFKSIRDKAYYNLGLKAQAKGDNLVAFLYFRDAFRLSAFDCGKGGTNNCLRWQAEQKMKEILGIKGIASYVTWQ